MRLLVFLLALLAAPLLAWAQPLPAEYFGRLPAVADAAISPDGRRVALALNSAAGEAAIVVVDLDGDGRRSGYRVGESLQLRGVGWADNERVSWLVSQTFRPGEVLPIGMRFIGSPRRVDYFRNGVISLADGEAQMLTTNPENPWADQGARLIAPIADDPGHARMIGRDPNGANAALFRVNLDSGRVRRLAPAGVNDATVSYVLDERGQLVGRFDTDQRSNRWRLFVYDGDRPRLLLENVSDYGQTISIVGLLPDGRFVAIDYNEAGFAALYAIDRSTGAQEVLFEREGIDVDAALVDPWTRRVAGAAWTEVEFEQSFFEPQLEAARTALAALLEGAAFRVESWSQDRSRFLVYVERGLDGGGYFVYNAGASNLRFLSGRYPELAQADVGERQSISYRARDGVRIPAYLTLPAGAEARNLPLVVLVHGGPHNVRDTMDFDWWAAFLVSRGYAVLQPNYRGSGGYGDAWEEAGRRQWGGLMQTDVEDGVAAVVRAGIADPARACIVGASYGGYAALAGATLTPDRYRCAVSVAGVSDLLAMLAATERETGGEDSFASDWWRASIGDRDEDRERIRSVSPAFLAAQVRIPILLIHGTDDTVVPIDQSRRMHRALTEAGKDVRFVELRGDDHWLSDAPTRIQMLREIETFLAQHLSQAAPAPAP